MRGNNRTARHSTAANIFGDALKRHRNSLAWSQEDLAGASGIAARTISDLERGVSQQPRSSTVRLLAGALGLSGADLAAFKAAARACGEGGVAGRPTPAVPAPAASAVGLAESLTMILENAASLAQVEPLLPGSVGCLVLVTSRRALTAGDVLAELWVTYLWAS
jgi:transcriptional regulator with XRE-family HTH domain